MDLRELKEDIDERFDRVESKLDTFIPLANKHEADLAWVKGFIKTSITLVATAISAIITYLIHK